MQQHFAAGATTPSDTTGFSYDGAGRLSMVTHAGWAINYTYDAAGRRATMTDPNGTQNYQYDDNDNPMTVTTAYNNGGPTATLGYGYNPDGSRQWMTLTSGPNNRSYTFQYQYDTLGRLSSLTNPNNEQTTWSYSTDNLQVTRTMANGASSKVISNVLGQMTCLINYDRLGAIRAQFSGFTYDGASHRTSVTSNVANQPTCCGTRGFTYTNNQLTGETFGTNFTKAYSYDPNGNIATIPGNELPGFNTGYTRLYNPDNNQWIGYQDLQGNPYAGNAALFQYDAHGNPTIYKGNTLTFDADDHMTAYGTQMQAGYTGDGLRAWKSSTANGTSYFVYDGEDLLAETAANGNVTCYNTWGDGDLVSRTNVNGDTSTSTFYQFDSEGNVLQHLDSSDTPFLTTAYDAWGNVIGGTATSDPYGYKGEFGYYTDSETGLILCTHRYYDPKAGRWLNEDPIGISGGLNLYGYCEADPVNSYDSSGYARDSNIFHIKLLVTGFQIIKRVTEKEAQKLRRDGENIAVITNKMARKIEKSVMNKGAIRKNHTAHQPIKGQSEVTFPHRQTDDVMGHTFNITGPSKSLSEEESNISSKISEEGSGVSAIFAMRPFHYAAIFDEARRQGYSKDESMFIVDWDLLNGLAGGPDLNYGRNYNGDLIIWSPGSHPLGEVL